MGKQIMTQAVNETVRVLCICQAGTPRLLPHRVNWKNRTHQIKQIGLHHTITQGTILYHIFSVITETLFMRLSFNTKSLLWTLEEVSDGIGD